MLRDFPWLYRSCCCLTWKYCHIAKTNTGSSQAVLRFCRVGDRWQPIQQYKTTNSVQKLYARISTVRTSVLHKVWMYEGKNKWLKMRDENTNTERHFSLPLQVPQTFLESNMRLSSRCHSNKNLAGDFTDKNREWLVIWTEMISSS